MIRLARFGSPYQYNQPLLKDRIGKKLWTINILLRVILNKVSLNVIPKPAIMLSQDATLNFRQIMRRADILTFCLGSCFIWILKPMFWKKIMNVLSILV